MQISDLFSLEDLHNRRSGQKYPVWEVYLTNYMGNLKVARETWSKRRLLFTFISFKKPLLIILKKKLNYLGATHNDISNINLQYYQRVSKRPRFSFLVFKDKIAKANVFFVVEFI